VRFVALSDTHRYHDKVVIPDGEVLLYAGDAVGNYGRSSDTSKHLEEFFKWLWVQSHRFAHVFFIAGNHETILDNQHGDASGIQQLESFLTCIKNCTYLQNAPATYRGLRLFGSPVTCSRMETEGKRYYSRAFEWPKEDRKKLWAALPEGLDLLMTHCPPAKRLSRTVGDPLLASRLEEMQRPPRFHVFGHDHDGIGVDSNGRTIFFNVAQDGCLRNDPNGGGCALMFDIEARDEPA
jgi:Icc-related predicted phosphoesterase